MSRNKQKYNEYMRDYMKQRYHTAKCAIIALLGGKCVKCQSDDRLEIDHEDFTTKSFTLSKQWSANNEKMTNELAKCQLLCYSCHKSKTSSEGSLADKYKEQTCACGRQCATIKEYAGHKRWCKINAER